MTELPGQLADPGRYLRAQRELADVSRNTLARLARVSECLGPRAVVTTRRGPLDAH